MSRLPPVFLVNLAYYFAKTDGTYAFPNSVEGDLLKTAKREIETLQAELEIARAFHRVAVAERDLARLEKRC